FSIGGFDYPKNPARPFKVGDILLIDAFDTDLREIEQGAQIVVHIRSEAGTCYAIGPLSIVPAGVDDRLYFVGTSQEATFVGSTKIARPSDRGGAVRLVHESIVTGRVIAWISGEQENKGEKR